MPVGSHFDAQRTPVPVFHPAPTTTTTTRGNAPHVRISEPFVEREIEHNQVVHVSIVTTLKGWMQEGCHRAVTMVLGWDMESKAQAVARFISKT